MNLITKSFIKTFLITGLIYGCLMAGDDYLGGNGFRLWRFIMHTVGFGLIMAFISNKNNSTPKN